MVRLNNRSTSTAFFIIPGIILLLTGMCWGIIGALQYIIPGLLKSQISFERIRPLHVSSVVFWIIITSVGCTLYYVQEHTGKNIYSTRLLKWQWGLFISAIGCILLTYLLGIFGGREYWEFHPVLALPVLISWMLCLYNFIRTTGTLKKQPVYVWMWFTGFIFFLITYLESYLWLIPYFRNNIVNDLTIQWKSYGSMVGSWNMLIYGCGIYLMDKISGTQTYSYSKTGFAIYFLGLFNLMFNWGHHIYTVPTHGYIKHVSYLVSMNELLLLGRIIFLWRQQMKENKKHIHQPGIRFYAAADFWIFLTLVLAIAMSIPAINVYTHGTHITVAHTMGATIGINTFLLLAVVFDQLNPLIRKIKNFHRYLLPGFRICNISLFIFWISLIVAGIMKAWWQVHWPEVPFSTMMISLRPYFMMFMITGVTLTAGMWMMLLPVVKQYFIHGMHAKKRLEVLYKKRSASLATY